MSPDFWQGFFAALIAVMVGAIITFVLMALRSDPPPPPPPVDTLFPTVPDDARELEWL